MRQSFLPAAVLLCALAHNAYAEAGFPLGGSGGSGSGTVNTGTAGWNAYYPSSGTAVSASPLIQFPNANTVTLGTSSSVLNIPNLAGSSAQFISIGTSGTSGLASAVTGINPSGDLSGTSSTCCTIAAIQGNSVGGTSGTGNVLFSSSAAVSGITLGTGSILSDVIHKATQVVATQVNWTSSTTFSNVLPSGISIVGSGTYACHGHLTGTAGASGGIQFKLNTSDTLSMTSMSATVTNYNGTTPNAVTTGTSFASAFAGTTAAFTDIYIDAAFVANVGGTLQLQATQNASNGTATSIYINSYLSCLRTA